MNTIHYNQLNEVMNCRMPVSPETVVPGMMATQYVGSDRYKLIVVAHPTKNTIITERYDEKVHGPVSVVDNVEFASPANFEERDRKFNEYHKARDKEYGATDEELKNVTYTLGETFSWRKNNRWMLKGSGMWGTCAVHVGKGDEYIDPDF